MKKGLFLTLLLAIALYASPIRAQTFGAKDAVALRLIGLDFQKPATGVFLPFDSLKTGLEASYIRNITQGLSLAIPVKAGLIGPAANRAGAGSKGFAAVDALIQLDGSYKNWFVTPYLYTGASAMYTFSDNQQVNFLMPLGAGLNFRITPGFFINVQTEYRISPWDKNLNHIQHSIGFAFPLGAKANDDMPMDKKMTEMVPPPAPAKLADADGDGIPDAIDRCPNEAGPASTGGCPDKDGDGVADKDDRCPDQAGPASLLGCPDKDGDGIADVDDRCPDQPGLAALKGCPDRDNDGVADVDDRCPDQKGLISLEGCPDRDGDGVADMDDRCPDQAGPKSNNGCPEVKKMETAPPPAQFIPEEVKKAMSYATQNVQFATGSAVLTGPSGPVLDNVATILKQNPNLRLKIEGHTDITGSAKVNLVLSDARAKSCRNYLVSRGISAERLSSEGFGSTRPIASNATKAGRDQNRRVDFIVF